MYEIEFITAACSCTVKEQNPGADLLVRSLATGAMTTFGNVAEFAWQDGGTLLEVVRPGGAREHLLLAGGRRAVPATGHAAAAE